MKPQSQLRIILTLAFALPLASAAQSAQTQAAKPTPAEKPTVTALAITDFLSQVKEQNGAYKAADLNRSAAESYGDEASLQLSPTFFASAQLNSDAKPSPFFRYDHIENSSYNVGLSQQFSFGLQAKFSYQFSDTNYVGIAPRYYEARPQLEATLPLWRNAFGRETRSSIDAALLASKAKAEGYDASAKAALLEAEAAYWRLALAREALKVSRDALSRAQAIFDWTERRVKLSLADRTEGLQSTAQLKARRLDVKQAEDDERSASLAFNAARGLTSDKVQEILTSINADLVAKWETPKRSQSRPDVEAVKLQLAAAEASATAAADRSKPSLELFGLYAFNSPQKATSSDAIGESWQNDKPSSTIGIRLQIPLDRTTTDRAQTGWLKEAQANRLLSERKLLEEERDWNDLTARFSLAKEKVRLYEDLEKAQQEKLEHERARQKAGRTTMAQVIQFENDFEQTQFARIRSLAELLNLNAQMKLYGVAYE
ncbi:MAG: TolC family protein [Bdellovibrionaceae bacterium]|nr:TolC family protein [Pseudobdellovibrionaceae bacterium]